MKIETCDGHFYALILPSDNRFWYIYCYDDNGNSEVVYQYGTYAECEYVVKRFLAGYSQWFIDHDFCFETDT